MLVSMSVDIEAPPEIVWSYLVEPEFPYGPVGKIIGFFAANTARRTGAEILANLKRLAEAEAASS